LGCGRYDNRQEAVGTPAMVWGILTKSKQGVKGYIRGTGDGD